MNRLGDRENAEAVDVEPTIQHVHADVQVTLYTKYNGVLPGYALTIAFEKVPADVTDKQIEGSVIEELDKLYQKKVTLRLHDKDNKINIFDAESIAFIKVDAVKVVREE